MYAVRPLMLFNKLWLWGFDNIRLNNVVAFFRCVCFVSYRCFYRWCRPTWSFRWWFVAILWFSDMVDFVAASFVKISLHINFNWVRISFDRSTQCPTRTHEYSLNDTITGELFWKQQQQRQQNQRSTTRTTHTNSYRNEREKCDGHHNTSNSALIGAGLLWWNDMRLTDIIQMAEY